jgi:hypothetical protein
VNNLIVVPTPKSLENEFYLDISEEAQKYFDKDIKPRIEEMVKAGDKSAYLGAQPRYFAYIYASLTKAGWIIEWDYSVKEYKISKKKKFQIGWRKVSFGQGVINFLWLVFNSVAVAGILDHMFPVQCLWLCIPGLALNLTTLVYLENNRLHDD